MIKNLQSLRGIAAILIFYHHYGFQSTIVQGFGDFGVVFFMMLSGFVLYLSAEKRRWRTQSLPELKKFMLLRVLKIYPLYLICWIAAILVLPYSGSLTGKVLGIFAIQSWIPDKAIYFSGNAVGWFICDLFFCYLLFVPLYRLIIKRPRIVYLIMVAYYVCYAFTVILLPEKLVHAIVYVNPLMQLANFLIGMLICRLYMRNDCASITSIKAGFLELMLILSVCVTLYFYEYISPRFAFGLYWWIVSGLVIYCFAKFESSNSLINRILQSKFLLEAGRVSFSFYMIHLIGISLWRRLPIVSCLEGESIYLQVISSVILLMLLVVASMLINKYVELPLNAKLKSRLVR